MNPGSALGLRARVALILSLFVAALATYYLAGWQPRARLNEAALLEERTRRVLQSSALGVRPYLVVNDLGTVHEVLANLEAANPDWRHFELWDAGGDRLYPLTQTPLPEGPNLRAYTQPVRLRGETIAELRVISDLGPDIAGMERHLRQLALWLLVGAFCMVAATAFLLERSVRRPLRDLAGAAQALAKGDFSIALRTDRQDEVGDLVRSFASMRDELAKQQALLRRGRDQAEAASEAKTRFLATMSHEMRTPLNAMLGMSELLVLTPLTDDQKELLETVSASGAVLLGLINDLLDLKQIEAGEVELDVQTFDLEALVESVCQVVAPTAHARGLSVEFDLPEPLSGHYAGDVHRLRQVLLNLMGNAVKFTEEGGVYLRVRRPDGSAEPALRFDVHDTGIGVHPDDHEAVFIEFRQLDGSNTRRYGGSGLGLSICASLAQLMGGRVWVDRSVPGEGTVMALQVPLVWVGPPQVATPSNDPPVPPTPGALASPARILVVEDNRQNRRFLCRALRLAGHSVEWAENGADGVALGAKGDFDLIFMDVEMPELDGISATRELRQHEQRRGRAAVPIVMLTGHAVDDIRRRCLDAGASEFLTKPFGRVGALQVVATWCAAGLPALLVVEDSPDLRRLLLRFARKDGRMRAFVAESGPGALEWTARAAFDAVLIAVPLSGTDAFETCATLRERLGPATPIAALTAERSPTTVEMMRSVGFDRMLPKPLHYEAFTAMVTEMLAGRVTHTHACSARPEEAAVD